MVGGLRILSRLGVGLGPRHRGVEDCPGGWPSSLQGGQRPLQRLPGEERTVSRLDPRQPGYHAYLLRLWRDNARQGWRASLQSTTTGQRVHFGTLDELFAFLDARLGADDGERMPNRRQP
jgi:hypothetical protein